MAKTFVFQAKIQSGVCSYIALSGIKSWCKKLCVLFRNLEAPEVPVYAVKGHKEIINAIDGIGGLGVGEGAPEIVTGSRDGECT